MPRNDMPVSLPRRRRKCGPRLKNTETIKRRLKMEMTISIPFRLLDQSPPAIDRINKLARKVLVDDLKQALIISVDHPELIKDMFPHTLMAEVVS
jgi:hypothetical protein